MSVCNGFSVNMVLRHRHGNGKAVTMLNRPLPFAFRLPFVSLFILSRNLGCFFSLRLHFTLRPVFHFGLTFVFLFVTLFASVSLLISSRLSLHLAFQKASFFCQKTVTNINGKV